jgi:hypothetical protein
MTCLGEQVLVSFYAVDGPSRHFAATQQFSRFRSEADIEWFSVCTEPVEFGPLARLRGDTAVRSLSERSRR